MFRRVLQSVMPARRKAGVALAAAKAMFAEGGALSLYPAPAALLRGDGAVIAENAAAARVGRIFGRGGEAAPLVAAALAAGRPATDTIVSDSPQNRGAALRLTAVPLGDGDAAVAFGHDVTHERALRAALVESRQRYKDLVEISSDFAWETGADGRFKFVSPAGALGHAADEFLDRRPEEFLVDTLPAEAASPFAAKSPVSGVDVWMRDAGGNSTLILASAVPVFDDAGAWSGARGICRDVTAERERDLALARAQNRERLIAYIVRTTHGEIDPRRMLLPAASAIAKALGGDGCCIYRRTGEGGFKLSADYARPPDQAAVEEGMLARVAAREGPVTIDAPGWHFLCVSTSYRNALNGAVIVARRARAGTWGDDERRLIDDVVLHLAVAIEQFAHHDRLEALSRTDELSALLNRRAFFAELETRISRMKSAAASGSLFFVDLDNFKSVNDVHGHERGDAALIAVSRILTANTRPGDLVARLGGDEFALWLDRTGRSSAVQRAGDLLRASRALDAFSGDPARRLGISVGIAVYDARTPESVAGLVARADAAMYEIKHGDKGGYVLAPPFAERAGMDDAVPAGGRAGVDA